MESLEQAVWADLQRGLPEGEITARHHITGSQLRVVTAVLEADGRLVGHVACPRCGHLERVAFSECPRCGVVVAKWAAREERGAGLCARMWGAVCEAVDTAWDRVDCGAYDVVMRVKERWGGK